MAWTQNIADSLWQSTLPVVLIALAATLLCRLTPTRPSTRHMLWVIVLAWFVAPAVLPRSVMQMPLAAVTASISQSQSEPRAQASGVALDTANAPEVECAAEPECIAIPETACELGDARPAPTFAGWKPAVHQNGVEAHSTPGHSTTAHNTLANCTAANDATTPSACPIDALTESASTTPDDDTPPAVTTPSRIAPVAPVDDLSDVAAKWWAAALASAQSGIGAWLAAGEVVFAKAITLPAVPPLVWVAGAALLAAVHVLSIIRFMRLTNTKIQTPPWVQRETDRLARRLGLAQSPRVLMVDANISPLVWCGVNPVMYVPVKLWLQLDDIGRRAVICHELAHLKRRDHWICWLEVLVTLLFWWHPVVWWVRRRIHEEADLCCDSWVTWLLPQGRRAYAEALLRTRTYVGRAGSCTPTAGLAVTSSDARELSRRITMVMTQRFGPRSSAVGLGMAAILVGLGWTVTPALSCPPEEAAAQKRAMEQERAAAHRAGVAFVQTAPTPAPTPPIAPGAPESPTPTARGSGSRGHAGSHNHDATTFERHMHGQAADGPAEYRPYNLSKEKMKHFWDLMSRDDVPIYVQQADEDTIRVQATPRQHEIFREFFRMIDPESNKGGSAGGGGGGSATTAPRARALAPLSFGWGQSSNDAPREQQARAEAFRARAEAHRAEAQAGRERARAAREQSRAFQKQAEELRKQAEKLREEAEKLREKADQMDEGSSSRTQIEQRLAAMESQSEAVESQAEALEDHMAQIEEGVAEADVEGDPVAAEIEAALADAPTTEGGLFNPIVVQPSVEDHRKMIESIVKEQTEAHLAHMKEQIAAQWQQSIRAAVDKLRSDADSADNEGAASVLRDLAEKLEAQINNESR